MSGCGVAASTSSPPTNIRLDDRRFLELAKVVCAAARRLGREAGGRGLAETHKGRFELN